MPDRPSRLRRVPLAALLLLTACMEDCDPLSERARAGVPHVAARIGPAGSVGSALPAVIYQDAGRTVRLIADTVRLYPASATYVRKAVIGVTPTGGAEARMTFPDGSASAPLLTTPFMIDGGVELRDFAIAPEVPLAIGQWRTASEREAWVTLEWKAAGDTTTRRLTMTYEAIDLNTVPWPWRK